MLKRDRRGDSYPRLYFLCEVRENLLLVRLEGRRQDETIKSEEVKHTWRDSTEREEIKRLFD